MTAGCACLAAECVPCIKANKLDVAANVLQDTSHSAAEEYDANSQLQSCEQLQSTEAEMQAQFLSDLAAMREEVEAAEKKLAAANAAADAVSQVPKYAPVMRNSA